MMKRREFIALAGCAAAGLAMAACGGNAAPASSALASSAPAAAASGGEADMENTRNADGIGQKELLVVSFGTSYSQSRRQTIGAIEAAMEQAFAAYSVRRAFTSQTIIDRLKERDGLAIDNVTEALERAVANGVKTLVVQPTHLMDGFEYAELADELARYADAFEQVAIGAPLLAADADFAAVAQAIAADTRAYDDGSTAICFMGHGTEAAANQVYPRMQQALAAAGFTHYYVGTVEAAPTLEDVLAAVAQGGYSKAVLQPLMIVAGDHANNDMAGEDEGSWKSAFEAAGYQTACVLRGLGELEDIRQLFVRHAQVAMDSLQ